MMNLMEMNYDKGALFMKTLTRIDGKNGEIGSEEFMKVLEMSFTSEIRDDLK